jgi:hypothetical protein
MISGQPRTTSQPKAAPISNVRFDVSPKDNAINRKCNANEQDQDQSHIVAIRARQRKSWLLECCDLSQPQRATYPLPVASAAGEKAVAVLN